MKAAALPAMTIRTTAANRDGLEIEIPVDKDLDDSRPGPRNDVSTLRWILRAASPIKSGDSRGR